MGARRDSGRVCGLRYSHRSEPSHAPHAELWETDEEIKIELPLPSGVSPTSVKIGVAGQCLEIRGERIRVAGKKGDECSCAGPKADPFHVRILLPGSVIPDDIDAVCGNSVLKLGIPKRRVRGKEITAAVC